MVRTSWFEWMFVLLVLIWLVLVAVAMVLIARRRKKREIRGFEVIMKPESEELPEARKE